MFLRSSFAFFDFGEPRIFFFLDYIAMMILFAAIGMMISVFLGRLPGKNNIRQQSQKNVICKVDADSALNTDKKSLSETTKSIFISDQYIYWMSVGISSESLQVLFLFSFFQNRQIPSLPTASGLAQEQWLRDGWIMRWNFGKET